MTAEEIKERPAEALTQSGWLREIAYQLARLNETPEPKPAITIKRK